MKRSHLTDVTADIVSGWVSGCSGVLVSHPLDTAKVRLQTQSVSGTAHHYSGTLNCLVDTVKHESFAGLYKGMSSPLLGTAAWNAVVFSSYSFSMRYLEARYPDHNLRNVFLSGIVAGLAQVPIICPLELTKTRLQIQSDSLNTKYTGLMDCVRKIFQADGPRGLYKGVVPTVCRDIVGFSTYFVFFDTGCRLLSPTGRADDMSGLSLVLAGGLSGALSWGLVFPQDVIKCRIQVDYDGKYNGMIDCLRKSFAEDGWSLFRRGFSATVIRGFPMNAAIFTVYTFMMRRYNKTFDAIDVAEEL